MVKLTTYIVKIFVFVALLILNIVSSQTLIQYSFPFIEPSSCTSTQFFNTANQRCEECSTKVIDSVPSADGLRCECPRTHSRSITLPRDVDDPFSCNLCSMNQVASSDGTGCIICGSGGTVIGINNQCQCSNSTLALVERDSTGQLMASAMCTACSAPSTGPASGTCVSCDTCGSCLCTPCLDDDVCLNNMGQTEINFAIGTAPLSGPYIDNRVAAAYAGCSFVISPNITACQVLSNLCVLELYETASRACTLYIDVFTTKVSGITLSSLWVENVPWIYYNQPVPTVPSISNDILTSTEILTSFSFKQANTVLDLLVFKYDANGEYLGWESATTGILQICPDRPAVKSAAFIFGTTYNSGCSLDSSTLTDRSIYPAEFYELYLRYTDSNVEQLFPIPVLITNYGDNAGIITSSWVFVKRFFLVDSLSQQATVRYVSFMKLQVILQPLVGSGLIYPPYLTVTYATVPSTPATPITTSFHVSYIMNMSAQVEGLTISLAVLGSLGILYALVETSAWRRRMGLQYVEGNSILMFVYFSIGNLANVFYIVMVGYASVTLFFFKGQSTVTNFLPDLNQQFNFVVFTSLAFAFKTIDVLGIIISQSLADIFLLDWERPRVKDSEGKVSIWRSYFIANEWNEIQTQRKIRFTFQLIAVVFFLEVVGFKSLALENANSVLSQTTTTSNDQYIPAYNSVLRFAVASLVFIVIALIQMFYFIVIHERFIEDKIREFVDLCSVSNVSIFILSHHHFGYYIHGRSVHGRADTDMLDMNTMLKKEEENLTSSRGLEAGSDQQTFEIAIPSGFRTQYDKIYQPLELMRSQPAARGGNTAADSHMAESARAYTIMRNFLSTFLDHSLRDLDYYIKDKMFLENMLDIEFQEPINGGAFFYNDRRNNFTNVLFYGREFALLTFDILLFNIIDYSTQNYLLAAVLTYVVGKVLVMLRQGISRSNLAKKTLVDKRFLI